MSSILILRWEFHNSHSLLYSEQQSRFQKEKENCCNPCWQVCQALCAAVRVSKTFCHTKRKKDNNAMENKYAATGLTCALKHNSFASSISRNISYTTLTQLVSHSVQLHIRYMQVHNISALPAVITANLTVI